MVTRVDQDNKLKKQTAMDRLWTHLLHSAVYIKQETSTPKERATYEALLSVMFSGFMEQYETWKDAKSKHFAIRLKPI